MSDSQFVKSSVNVMPQWPKFFGCPVAVYLRRFDVDVLKPMCRQVKFLGNWGGSKCEVVTVANVDRSSAVLLAGSGTAHIRSGFNK
jgi:hypothetical protein